MGRIIPGEPFMNAMEAFSDIVGILPDKAAKGREEAGRDGRTLHDERISAADGQRYGTPDSVYLDCGSRHPERIKVAHEKCAR